MKSRIALSAAATCVVLAPLTGCGSDGTSREPSPSDGGASAAPVPSAPAESRPPTPGKGSKDPDDINGDGHRDLLVPVGVGSEPETPGREERIGVVYGSAKGLDPATRTVYGRGDLGLPGLPPGQAGPDSVYGQSFVTADLDGDGFPDFVTSIAREEAKEGQIWDQRMVPYVAWGSPSGPRTGAETTEVRLPQNVANLGVGLVERGDFDGDGHHDLAALAQNESSLVVLYGPFTRAGAPARTDTTLPWSDGKLIADDIDPTGKTRATSLLLQGTNDGEQSANTLYSARQGEGPSPNVRQLRRGNAHAWGDFDGDGQRDVTIGDDGGRNNEPGYESEAPEVDGSLTVYPGTGATPITHRLPEPPENAETDYGPGDFAAADPDGDGRDGILVATYENATLIDGNKRTPVLREGPAKADGKKIPPKWRHARPAGAADFDTDGKDELILNWAADSLFGIYGQHPTHWWITDGTTTQDKVSFTTTSFAPPGS
ncbi:FG-GAP repeat domain-containing protein [Streptomyces sp. CA-288835]|uniref:FG-GAP repeat domain-containing protein n=1 Tax=Streptomyces sp. CA-288835 TaxID=3240069 RepID=UPI003D92144A